MPPPTKRRRTEATIIEEIIFDPSDRQEYLTGFHKRKLQRAKHAQEAAERRAREERIADRKKLREDRKADLDRHVQEINALLKQTSTLHASEDEEDDPGSDEEWTGLTDREPPPIDHEAEYIDEDKYTTITIETMDVTREGLFKAEQDGDQEEASGEKGPVASERPSEKKKRQWTKKKPKDEAHKHKKKKRNFRYESKAERKMTRTKERSKNRKQARERRAE